MASQSKNVTSTRLCRLDGDMAGHGRPGLFQRPETSTFHLLMRFDTLLKLSDLTA